MPDEATKPQKRARLSPAQWAEIKQAFEGGMSEVELAKTFKVDRKTIRARKKAEAWIPHVVAQVGKDEAEGVRNAARSNVISIASRQAIDSPAGRQAVADAEDAVRTMAEVLQRTTRVLDLAAEYTEDVLLLATGKEPRNRSHILPGDKQSAADVFKSIMAGLGSYSTLLRETTGKKVGMPTTNDDSLGAGKPKGIRLVIAPRPDVQAG